MQANQDSSNTQPIHASIHLKSNQHQVYPQHMRSPYASQPEAAVLSLPQGAALPQPNVIQIITPPKPKKNKCALVLYIVMLIFSFLSILNQVLNFDTNEWVAGTGKNLIVKITSILIEVCFCLVMTRLSSGPLTDKSSKFLTIIGAITVVLQVVCHGFLFEHHFTQKNTEMTCKVVLFLFLRLIIWGLTIYSIKNYRGAFAQSFLAYPAN
jgi:hypothetical protein